MRSGMVIRMQVHYGVGMVIVVRGLGENRSLDRDLADLDHPAAVHHQNQHNFQPIVDLDPMTDPITGPITDLVANLVTNLITEMDLELHNLCETEVDWTYSLGCHTSPHTWDGCFERQRTLTSH